MPVRPAGLPARSRRRSPAPIRWRCSANSRPRPTSATRACRSPSNEIRGQSTQLAVESTVPGTRNSGGAEDASALLGAEGRRVGVALPDEPSADDHPGHHAVRAVDELAVLEVLPVDAADVRLA